MKTIFENRLVILPCDLMSGKNALPKIHSLTIFTKTHTTDDINRSRNKQCVTFSLGGVT